MLLSLPVFVDADSATNCLALQEMHIMTNLLHADCTTNKNKKALLYLASAAEGVQACEVVRGSL